MIFPWIIGSGIVDKVIDEGPSQKMREVASLAGGFAREGRKSVIWTIFTNTILEMEKLLSDLNPVTSTEISPGDEESPDTREGRIKRFHKDPPARSSSQILRPPVKESVFTRYATMRFTSTAATTRPITFNR